MRKSYISLLQTLFLTKSLPTSKIKMKCLADKIFYNFSQENPNIKSILNPYTVYMYFNAEERGGSFQKYVKI